MQKYKIIKNQNIFDVALSIYGSIEGVFDLLVNNDDLSFDTQLQEGDTLFWDEEFIIYNSIVNALKDDNIIPANGERHVYHKETNAILRCCITVSSDATHIKLLMAGDGDVVIDWGDNSDLETIVLQPIIQQYTHYFDNLSEQRILRLYGNFNLKTWDLSTIKGVVLPTMPLIVDEVISKKNNISLQGLFLFDGTYSVVLSEITLSSLAVLQKMNLSYLELKKIDYSTDTILDDYLIYLANNNNQRRNCKVVIDKQPSGSYREPAKDNNGNYIIKTGMEAIYVIIHEPAWNEAGPWVFDVNGKIYSADNLEFNYTLSMIIE